MRKVCGSLVYVVTSPVQMKVGEQLRVKVKIENFSNLPYVVTCSDGRSRDATVAIAQPILGDTTVSKRPNKRSFINYTPSSTHVDVLLVTGVAVGSADAYVMMDVCGTVISGVVASIPLDVSLDVS